MSSPYRLSDAERNEAIEALTDAYVDGRLGSEEFEERMTQASSAVHAADLDPLFADLPPRRTPGRAVQPSPAILPQRLLSCRESPSTIARTRSSGHSAATKRRTCSASCVCSSVNPKSMAAYSHATLLIARACIYSRNFCAEVQRRCRTTLTV